MDGFSWGALALALTLFGGAYTWWAYRRRGVTAAVRGLALTLLPPAAWMTGTLKMFGRIVDAVVDWATHLVFSPVVWAGVVLFGVSVVLFGASGFLRRRGLGGSTSTTDAPAGVPADRPAAGQLNRPSKPKPAIDDDLSDIEAILKRRGIS
ncbi:MAG TPA: hypothetical protein VGJ41_02830 [Nocardioides sp.]